ncbi:hypothetical protein [Thermocrinis sp.]
MKVRLSNIKDLDELIFRLSGLGIDLSEVYRQLETGKTESLEISIREYQLHKVRSAVGDLCFFEIIGIEENNRAVPLLLLGILWIDNTLLYFLLKFSFLSQDFSYSLSSILGYDKLVGFVKGMISLMAIATYYSGFVLVKGTTPVGRFFNMKIERDHKYFIVLFALPLVAFKLLQFDQVLIKLFGFFTLSLCIVLPFYLQGSVKYV